MYNVILTHGAVMPTRNTTFDSGMDIRAKGFSDVIDGKIIDPVWFDDVDGYDGKYVLKPSQIVLVKTGIQIQQPHPFNNTYNGLNNSDNIKIMKFLDIQIRPRSGLALKKGVTVLNSPGTVDVEYVNDIGVILINHGSEPFEINDGDRIAQLIISEVSIPHDSQFKVVDSFNEESERGMSGFGDSGTK